MPGHIYILKMKEFEEKIKVFIEEHNIKAKQMFFKEEVKSVEQSANVSKTDPNTHIKSIVFNNDGKAIVAIVSGMDRVDVKKIKNILDIKRPSIAGPEEILKLTGFPVGGVPPFGFEAVFLIDNKIMEMDEVISGGGSPYCLLSTTPEEIKKATNAKVADIKKD